MLAEQHDLIVFGAGLAGQTAATLLARQGYRVLLLETPAPADSQPLPCCPALDKLLASLEAQQLVHHANDCFQLITDEIRLEVGGARPLAQELEREFPDHHAAILALLTRLDAWGQRLGLLLTGPAPDSPWPLIRVLALYRRQWRQGLPAHHLRQPVGRLLATLTDKGPQQAVLQLLSGLCLRTPAQLSTAEAALNWHVATRPQRIDFRQLTQLLSERFAAAGGRSLPLQELDELQWQGKRLQGIRLQDGRRLQARQFLAGPGSGSIEPPPATASALADGSREPQRWIVSGVKPRRPPILASRVILGGAPALHLSWEAQEGPAARIQVTCPAEPAITDPEPLNRRLAALLPFTEFKLSPGHGPATAGALEARSWLSMALPQPVANNLLFCHRTDLLPSAANTAALMLGQAAAGLLHKRLG